MAGRRDWASLPAASGDQDAQQHVEAEHGQPLGAGDQPERGGRMLVEKLNHDGTPDRCLFDLARLRTLAMAWFAEGNRVSGKSFRRDPGERNFSLLSHFRGP